MPSIELSRRQGRLINFSSGKGLLKRCYCWHQQETLLLMQETSIESFSINARDIPDVNDKTSKKLSQTMIENLENGQQPTRLHKNRPWLKHDNDLWGKKIENNSGIYRTFASAGCRGTIETQVEVSRVFVQTTQNSCFCFAYFFFSFH